MHIDDNRRKETAGFLTINAMLKLLLFGGFILVVNSQLLYESISANDTFLLYGKETELGNLLNSCEKNLKDEVKQSSELIIIRKEQELSSKLKTLTLAIKVLQMQHDVTGKIS